MSSAAVTDQFKPGVKVRSSLGAEGTVEGVVTGKDGQLRLYIRWRTGALGAYTTEEAKRYALTKV
jgi:hypothetical protein